MRGDLPPARQREPQARIRRHRERGKSFGREEIDLGTEPDGGVLERTERAHDAVDLRMPGVRRHEYFHLFVPGRDEPGCHIYESRATTIAISCLNRVTVAGASSI